MEEEFNRKLLGTMEEQGDSFSKILAISLFEYLSFTRTSTTKATSEGMALCCLPACI